MSEASEMTASNPASEASQDLLGGMTQLLQDAGIDSLDMIDPISLRSLQEYLSLSSSSASLSAPVHPIQEDERGPAPTARSPSTTPLSSAPLLVVNPLEDSKMEAAKNPAMISTGRLYHPSVSALTEASNNTFSTDQGMSSFSSQQPEASSDASVAGSWYDHKNNKNNSEKEPPATHLTLEERILQHLERQTFMLEQLHRRVDDLSAQIQQITTTSGHAAPSSTPRPLVAWRRNVPTTPVPTVPAPPAPALARETPARAVLPPPNALAEEAQRPPRHAWWTWLQTVWNDVQTDLKRLYQTWRLFQALRRRQVPNLELGLLFKVAFILIILTSRMMRRRPDYDDGGIWMYKLYLLVTVVLVGMLWQTGYLTFAYKFFVKENYPARIWAGEVLDEAGVMQEEQARRNRPRPAAAAGRAPAVAAADRPGADDGRPEARPPRDREEEEEGEGEAGGGWRNTFLGGGIAAVDPLQQSVVFRVMYDIVVLLGSFILSIFPMWHPAAIPARRGPEEEDAEAEREEPNRGENGQPNGDQPQELPRVRPPMDPAEADANDDE